MGMVKAMLGGAVLALTSLPVQAADLGFAVGEGDAMFNQAVSGSMRATKKKCEDAGKHYICQFTVTPFVAFMTLGELTGGPTGKANQVIAIFGSETAEVPLEQAMMAFSAVTKMASPELPEKQREAMVYELGKGMTTGDKRTRTVSDVQYTFSHNGKVGLWFTAEAK